MRHLVLLAVVTMGFVACGTSSTHPPPASDCQPAAPCSATPVGGGTASSGATSGGSSGTSGTTSGGTSGGSGGDGGDLGEGGGGFGDASTSGGLDAAFE